MGYNSFVQTEEEQNNSQPFQVQLTFLIFSLGYLFLLILTVKRVTSAFKKKTSLIVCRVFYILTIILCAYCMLSSILIIVQSIYNTDMDQPRVFLNIIYISDAIFCLMFFNLFWFTIVYHYKSHVRVGNVLESGKNPAASNSGLNIFMVIFSLYCVTQIIYIAVFNVTDSISQEDYLLGEASTNLISVIYYFIGYFVMAFKFSGTPFKSLKLEKEMKHLTRMGHFWVLGRIAAAVFSFFLFSNSSQIQKFISGTEGQSNFFQSTIIYFILPATFIISEVMPIIYALQLESVKILCKNIRKSEITIQQRLLNEDERLVIGQGRDDQVIHDEGSVDGSFISIASEPENEKIVRIDFDDQTFMKQIEKRERKKGLGYIQRVLQESHKPKRRLNVNSLDSNAGGDYQQQSRNISHDTAQQAYDNNNEIMLAFRRLPVNSLSPWILQEMNYDLRMMKQLGMKHVLNVKSIAMDKESVYLVSPFLCKGSLNDILLRSGNKPSSGGATSIDVSFTTGLNTGQQKKELQLNLPNSNQQSNFPGIRRFIINTDSDISDIQAGNGFKLSAEFKMRIAIEISSTMSKLHKFNVFHGHLTSSNILFDDAMGVMISDIGLTSLKKLMGIMHGYSNKSYFTAPEHLQDSQNIVRNPNSKSDIYSFAFILYELYMEREAFGKLNLDEVKKMIIENNSRPKIPEVCPKEIATIIRYCWLENPAERPEFRVIVENLKRLNNEPIEEDDDLFEARKRGKQLNRQDNILHNRNISHDNRERSGEE